MLVNDFRREVIEFITTYGMSDREFSLGCGMAPNFVHHIRRRRVPRADTIDKVRAWMRIYAVPVAAE